MTDKKFCRPRMTIEARDALNRMCKAQMDEGLFVNDRSDAIVCIESDFHQMNADKEHAKKMLVEEQQRSFNFQIKCNDVIESRNLWRVIAIISMVAAIGEAAIGAWFA